MKKLISVCLLLISCSALADKAATVLFVKNQVTGNSGSLSRGASLNAGDSIKTGAGSTVSFKYTNGTLVTLGENSNYTILSYSPKQGDTDVNAELKKGSLALKTTGGKNEKLKTPTVALAILGSGGLVLVNPNGSVNVKVTDGTFSAGGQSFTAGSSFGVSTSGAISAAPFPASAAKALAVDSSSAVAAGAEGAGGTEGSSTSTEESSSESSTTSSSSESESSGGDEGSEAASSSSSSTGDAALVSSAMVGTSTAGAAEGTSEALGAALATLDWSTCLPSF